MPPIWLYTNRLDSSTAREKIWVLYWAVCRKSICNIAQKERCTALSSSGCRHKRALTGCMSCFYHWDRRQHAPDFCLCLNSCKAYLIIRIYPFSVQQHLQGQCRLVGIMLQALSASCVQLPLADMTTAGCYCTPSGICAFVLLLMLA